MRTALKMKIFQRIQSYLASSGFRQNESPFNETQLRILVNVFLNIALQYVHLIHESSTIKQYVDSIFMITATILTLVARTSMLLKNDAIFELIDKVEHILNDSKLNFYFEYTNSRMNSNQNKTFLRVKISNIEKVVRKHQSTCGNCKCDHQCHHRRYYTARFDNTKSDFLLCPILSSRRYRNGCFWVVSSSLVCVQKLWI